jgi:hypothetical protein
MYASSQWTNQHCYYAATAQHICLPPPWSSLVCLLPAGDDSLPDGVPREDLEPISRRLDELARTHARALQAFTEKLPAQVGELAIALS